MDVVFRLKIFLALVPVFWALIYFLNSRYDLESRGISLSPGTIMWKTDKGLSLLDKISKKGKRFWSVYGKVSAALGAVLMVVFFAFVFRGVVIGMIDYLSPGGMPEFPTSVKTRPIIIPGVNTPIFLGLISFAVILIMHEGAHGIILKKLRMKTKSAGLAVFLFVIPGAFVEQDDEEFENVSPWNRMKIAGAGPITNIFGAFLALLVVILLINPLSGVFITSVVHNSAAENAGVKPGNKILSIDGIELENHQQFLSYMEETRPGDVLNVKTGGNTYQVPLGNHPTENIGYLGIYSTTSQSKKQLGKTFLTNPRVLLIMAFGIVIGESPLIDNITYSSIVPWGVIELLKWIFSLSFLVGLINLLPLKPLDGGHIVKAVSEKFTGSKGKGRVLTNLTSIISVSLILFNLFLIYA